MHQNKSKDNRAYSRIDVDVAVEVTPEPDTGLPEGRIMICRARDISLAGMCIYTDTAIPQESRLLLNIELGTPPRMFNLMGKVIWSTPDPDSDLYRTGIHLIRLPGDSAAWHAAVLQKLVG